MDAGEMSFDDVRCAYASWKGGVSHYDSYNVVKSMDKLFDELFIHPFIEGGHRDEQNKNEQKWDRAENKRPEDQALMSGVWYWGLEDCQVYSTLGMESPYDLQELHKQRQVIRDEIGALEEELAKCEDEDEAAAEK